MNAVINHPGRSYAKYPLRGQRDIEYEAFSRVTRDLAAAYKSGPTRDLILAVYKNNELWVAIASSLADPANIFPAELRGSLISLALFSLRTGHEYMESGGDVQVLIDINMSIMKGLRGESNP